MSAGKLVGAPGRPCAAHHQPRHSLVCRAQMQSVNKEARPSSQDVQFATKQVAPNRWKIIASTKVPAEKAYLWQALTDYENLHTFIPGLVENVCSQRVADGCTLTQVAAQRIAFATINVKATLRVREHKGGLPRHLVGDLATFPEPLDWNPGAEPWDITFSMLQGDFQLFNGVWRMQELANRSILSYHLLVSPPKLLPVQLIQSFIEREVCNNLKAVRSHAVSLATSAGNGNGKGGNGAGARPTGQQS